MSQDLVAAFLAKGGKIRKIEESASNGMNRRDWYKAVRAESPSRDNSVPIVAVVDHIGRTWYKNQEGEVIGCD